MLVNLLLIILSLIILFLGYFLWVHRQKPFLIFDPTKTAGLTKFLSFWSIILIILGIITIGITFSQQTLLIALILVIDAIAVSLLSFLMLAYLH